MIRALKLCFNFVFRCFAFSVGVIVFGAVFIWTLIGLRYVLQFAGVEVGP